MIFIGKKVLLHHQLLLKCILLERVELKDNLLLVCFPALLVQLLRVQNSNIKGLNTIGLLLTKLLLLDGAAAVLYDDHEVGDLELLDLVVLLSFGVVPVLELAVLVIEVLQLEVLLLALVDESGEGGVGVVHVVVEEVFFDEKAREEVVEVLVLELDV